MSHKQLRVAQLIAPFGPGSLYTDRKGVPHVVCGLDEWFYRENPTTGHESCERPEEFAVFEPRLIRYLQVDLLKTPAPFREVRRGARRPENAGLYTPAHRFPTWYRQTKTGELKKMRLHQLRVDPATGGGRWQPVRFVSVCERGHLSDFPWKKWCRCRCEDGHEKLHLIDLGGTDLSSIRIECQACGAGMGASFRTLSGVTVRPNASLGEQSAFQKEGIPCLGERPWLGEGAEESCGEPLVGALINQTNLYFAQTASAIYIPDVAPMTDEIAHLRELIGANGTLLMQANLLQNLPGRAGVTLASRHLADLGVSASEDAVEKALEGLLNPAGAQLDGAATPSHPENGRVTFRRAEFDVLRLAEAPMQFEDLHVVPVQVPDVLTGRIAKVQLVERLRETRAFYGFDRLTPTSDKLSRMPDVAMQQLFRNPPSARGTRWLPAVVVYGEGIYLELSEPFIRTWQQHNAAWLEARLTDMFITRVADLPQTLVTLPATRSWASRYLLVHTLAHALINQMVFECGYSTASLRERLFISDDPSAPMAGTLIYTSAGDSEGTLGGLVRLGRTERFGNVFRRAISRISWCSADPVCSEELGGQGAQLANLGACHACVLLPETSCETINNGLDRGVLVGTPAERAHGAFSDFIDQMVQYD